MEAVQLKRILRINAVFVNTLEIDAVQLNVMYMEAEQNCLSI